MMTFAIYIRASDQPFRKAGLPVLAGMVITFALLAGGAAVGGSWLVQAIQFGRATALARRGSRHNALDSK
jgi:hypothetical protein